MRILLRKNVADLGEDLREVTYYFRNYDFSIRHGWTESEDGEKIFFIPEVYSRVGWAPNDPERLQRAQHLLEVIEDVIRNLEEEPDFISLLILEKN